MKKTFGHQPPHEAMLLSLKFKDQRLSIKAPSDKTSKAKFYTKTNDTCT
jgi:hypothetical protein